MMKKFIFFVSLGIFCLSTCFVSAQTPAGKDWPLHLRIVTSPVGGQWHTLGENFARSLGKILPTTSKIGFGIKNINAVNNKTSDLAFTLTCFLKAALSGDEQYKFIGPVDNVTVLANIYPQVLYTVVRKDFADKNQIDSFEKLIQYKGAVRFATLKPGSTSEFLLNLLLLHGYKTNFDALRAAGWQVNFYNFSDMADKLSSGDIDCFAYTAGSFAPLIRDLADQTPVVLLPIRQDVLEILHKQFNTETYTIQPGHYKNVDAPVQTLSDFACIIVSKDLPADLVHAVTTNLWEQRQYIGGDIADFKYLNPATAMPKGIPMHPGAQKAWEEIKQKQ